jgi:hypothetical protein
VKLSSETQNWNFNDTGTNRYEKLINVTAKVDQALEIGVDMLRDEDQNDFEPSSLKIHAEVHILDQDNDESVLIIDENGSTLKGLMFLCVPRYAPKNYITF